MKGHSAWSNWKRVYNRKEFRGLWVINLQDFNNVLLLKWWWKLFDDPNRKWETILSYNYRPLTEWWSDKCINKTFASPIWKGMITINEIFFIVTARKVNNGRGTRF